MDLLFLIWLIWLLYSHTLQSLFWKTLMSRTLVLALALILKELPPKDGSNSHCLWITRFCSGMFRAYSTSWPKAAEIILLWLFPYGVYNTSTSFQKYYKNAILQSCEISTFWVKGIKLFHLLGPIEFCSIDFSSSACLLGQTSKF